MAKPSISVCSVSYKNSTHLNLNYELAEKLNNNSNNLKWIIAENSPFEDEERLPIESQRFKVIDGVMEGSQANIRHTEALHKCLELVDTRFLLVMDPDFYILFKDWMSIVIDHMLSNNLCFFGVPWHPRFNDKYRYFPCVHCLFVDLEKVNIKDLDFRPFLSDELDKSKTQGALQYPDEAFIYKLISEGAFGSSIQHRYRKFFDTGTRLYFKFKDDSSHLSECVLPVYREKQERSRIRHVVARSIELLLPDRLCYLPKRGSFSTSGLREKGYLANAPQEWDEFVWREKAFGFHVRRNSNKKIRNAQNELDQLKNLLGEVSQIPFK